MKRAIAIFLILACLIAFVKAADVPVTVGSETDELKFEPAMIMAQPGDNIVFTWAGKLQHSIVESDEAKSCAKSKKADAFTSGGAFTAPKTWTLPVPKAGKMWFYCGFGTHCSAGNMYATLIVGDAAGNNTATPSGGASNTASMSMMPSGTGSMMPSGTSSGSAPSTSTSSAARNYAAGFIVSSMCMVAALML